MGTECEPDTPGKIQEIQLSKIVTADLSGQVET